MNITLFDPIKDIDDIEEIFFITSAIQKFKSVEAKNSFKYKYLSFYLETYSEFVLVAKNEQRVLGYCLGSPVTDESFYFHQPHLKLFSDLYDSFPAHLHINLHPSAQGLGIGQMLMGQWENLIKKDPLICGMHIMTSPDARNIRFYRRLGFVTENVRIFKEHSILFMGKYF